MCKQEYRVATHFLPYLLQDFGNYIGILEEVKVSCYKEYIDTIFDALGLKCVCISDNYYLHGNLNSILLEDHKEGDFTAEESIKILENLSKYLETHEDKYHYEYDEEVCYDLWEKFEKYLIFDEDNNIVLRDFEFVFREDDGDKEIQFFRSGLGLLCCIQEHYNYFVLCDKLQNFY